MCDRLKGFPDAIRHYVGVRDGQTADVHRPPESHCRPRRRSDSLGGCGSPARSTRPGGGSRNASGTGYSPSRRPSPGMDGGPSCASPSDHHGPPSR
ncbi:hypothetical protein [Microbacterium terrisoli]|uniref:hypothetical protein n=1 Tax=Microbacterium terrisoli TaxID=3242192 RepID=UPI003F8B9359